MRRKEGQSERDVREGQDKVSEAKEARARAFLEARAAAACGLRAVVVG